MRRYLVLMICLISQSAKAQDERFPLKQIGDWNICLAKSSGRLTYRLDSATHMVERTVIATNVIRVKKYSLTGPIVSLLDYTLNATTNKRELHGRFIKYKPSGVADTSGYFKNNIKDGDWLVYDDSARAIAKLVYKNGVMESVEKLKPVSREEQEARKKACTTCEPAAYSFNGDRGWKKYIATSATPTQRYTNLLETRSRREARALASFVIDTAGKVADVFMLKSVEWSMDKKITDAILNGGPWQPARKDGVALKAFRNQPVTIIMHEKRSREQTGSN